MVQELLLRHCVAALLGWHRIAALEGRRAHLLADHLRKEHTLRRIQAMLRAWHSVSEVATAQTSFILQSLSSDDRSVMTDVLRGWQARCHLRQRMNAFR